MTFRDLWKTIYGCKVSVRIDHRCDFEIVTDWDELNAMAKSDYLGSSTVDSVTVTDGILEIEITVPNVDMGELEVSEEEFNLIFNTASH